MITPPIIKFKKSKALCYIKQYNNFFRFVKGESFGLDFRNFEFWVLNFKLKIKKNLCVFMAIFLDFGSGFWFSKIFILIN